MKHFYSFFILIFLSFAAKTQAQSCDSLKATLNIIESRCTATGAIQIHVTGGSGNYKYKISGPVNSNFTSSNYISGLGAGTYSVLIHDITNNCEITENEVIVPGSYEDPRFTLTSEAVSCDNGSNGSINLLNLQHGRSPFTFSIVAPSADNIGATNNTGYFNNLKAGDYRIQLADSCGGIQTRTISIDNYTWNISDFSLNKISCDSASGYIRVTDSKGNDSKIKPIEGMTYGLAIPGLDTMWQQLPDFNTEVIFSGKVSLLAKDACGNIKSVQTSISYVPAVNSTVTVSDKVCDSYSASIGGVKNFKNPKFSLLQNNVLIESNETGKFTNLQYNKDYCIKVQDNCSDTTITRCFNTAPPESSVAKSVKITNYTCSTFNAAITGQTNLTNAFYILLNSENQFIDLNYTGTFTKLPYGSYCIMVRDGCRDTSLTRCFTVTQPKPGVDSVLTPSYVNCDFFGITIGGVNLTSPTFCIFDKDSVQIECNTTGRFDSIPLGAYTITVHDGCTDTTITRYIDIDTPTLKNDVKVAISNKTCTTFTATLSTKDFKGGTFSLFKADDSPIATNTTGRFDQLPYGNYYFYSRAVCPDTTVRTPLKAAPDIPSVAASVSISNKTCGTFSATISGQKFLTNPVYQLTDSENNTIQSNNTGKFNNIPYGAYCIKIMNGCFDTTLTRCFSAAPNPFSFTATPAKSCNYGFGKVTVNLSGNFPVNVKIYSPDNDLLHDHSYTQSSLTVDNLPNLESNLSYKIVAADACGNEKTSTFKPVVSYLTHSVKVENKCPGSKWENGYGNITATVSSNAAALVVRIIKKDAQSLNTAPQMTNGNFTFTNLGPATYILRYYANDGCNNYFYDTVKVAPYEYPGLSKSSAYKCDENGYSVGAVVTNGIGPFTYSIIGSYPDNPSIVTGPVNEPVFNVNNGTDYSLVRLRAMDACGNATLGDANILPLAQNNIRTTYNCFGHPATLTLDTVYNATVSWYKKDALTDTDSSYVGSGFSLHLPAITPKDTGIYVAHSSINNGCIQRVYNININGDCYAILPVTISGFTGHIQGETVVLDWDLSNASGLKGMVIERETQNGFKPIGQQVPANVTEKVSYQYIDPNPETNNFYRIKFINADGSSTYSKVIHIKFVSGKTIKVFPNPVSEIININFAQTDNQVYRIVITNTLSQKVKEVTHINTGGVLKIKRNHEMSPGFYFISIYNLQTQTDYKEKIIMK